MELISQAEFARRVGASKQRVNVLVNEGRLPLVDKKIPYEQAVAVWETCRDITYSTQAAIGRAKKGHHPTTSITAIDVEMEKEIVKAVQQPAPVVKSEDDEETVLEDATPDLKQRLNLAKTLKEEAVAKTKELEYLEKKKKYIHIDDIKADAQALGAELREKLLVIPSRVAPSVYGREVVEIEDAIMQEINAVLEGLKGKYL